MSDRISARFRATTGPWQEFGVTPQEAFDATIARTQALLLVIA